MVNPLLFNMFTGMNVALLKQGIEQITRRAYARLVLISEKSLYMMNGRLIWHSSLPVFTSL
ncbi:hypothetical protein F4826_004374 [Rahnella inusitata]|jgi:hypothetical protein|nr:hypothetical protein [Rahnella inusitata]